MSVSLGANVSIAQILKLALDQYEEPDISIATVPPRYPFMGWFAKYVCTVALFQFFSENTFRFVDSVLSSDEIEDSIITEIEKCFEV